MSIAGKILTRILFSRLLRTIADDVLQEAQCGFRPKRGTSDMIFAAGQIQEKGREQHRDLHTVFVDLTKAFHMVSRSGLLLLLRKYGCTEKFTRILKSLHESILGRVIVGGEFSEPFPVTNGVRQRCIAGPILFNIFYAARLLSRLRASSKVFEQILHELLYADDCALEAHSLQDIQLITDRFAEAAKKYGLVIYIQKTEIMLQPAPGNTYNDPIVTVDSVPQKPVKEFCYLGSIFASDALIDKEIANCISRARASFGRLHSRVWNEKGIQLHTKFKVYKVLTNLLYGCGWLCGTWTCYRQHIKALDKFHMRHLRILVKIK